MLHHSSVILAGTGTSDYLYVSPYLVAKRQHVLVEIYAKAFVKSMNPASHSCNMLCDAVLLLLPNCRRLGARQFQ